MVAPLIGSALIGGASSLLGGLFGRSSAKKTAAANRELNQNKIQWTVADAKKAGIHPLAALGSPVSGAWAVPQQQNYMGDALGEAGAKLAAIPQAAGAAKQSTLQNQLIQSQIGRTNAETANLISEATSRSRIANLRAINTNNPHSADSEEITTTQVPLMQTHHSPDGSTTVPVGPDLGEIISGASIYGWTWAKKKYGAAKTNRAQKLASGYNPNRTRPKARPARNRKGFTSRSRRRQ